ncbi:MAG: ATP-binding protein [Candidatus Adiutrix sp.]
MLVSSNLNSGDLAGDGAPGAIQIDQILCLKCGLCLFFCPSRAITLAKNKFEVGALCEKCLSCFELCPAGAISLKK